mgnify:CR=1 FL=1
MHSCGMHDRKYIQPFGMWTSRRQRGPTEADVDSFANNYFNWHFPKAVKYCTQESERWLRYAASNVNETDVELLRQKPEDASIEITDIDFGDDEQVPPLPLRFIIFSRWTVSGRIRSS